MLDYRHQLGKRRVLRCQAQASCSGPCCRVLLKDASVFVVKTGSIRTVSVKNVYHGSLSELFARLIFVSVPFWVFVLQPGPESCEFTREVHDNDGDDVEDADDSSCWDTCG